MPYDAETTESLDNLHVPLKEFKTAAQRDLLHAAGMNLAASKAWQDCPTTSITFIAPCDASSYLSEVLRALAPLGGEHIEALSMVGTCEELENGRRYLTEICLGKADVEALAASLGSGITSLYLNCSLSCSVWPALARCFPAVTKLSLGERLRDVRSMHLAMWARELGHPVTIFLRSWVPCLLCMCEGHIEKGPDWHEQRCNCMRKVVQVLADFGVKVTFKRKGVDEEDSE
jgi:hypothetical protein